MKKMVKSLIVLAVLLWTVCTMAGCTTTKTWTVYDETGHVMSQKIERG